jgi:hypothetical protein
MTACHCRALQHQVAPPPLCLVRATDASTRRQLTSVAAVGMAPCPRRELTSAVPCPRCELTSVVPCPRRERLGLPPPLLAPSSHEHAASPMQPTPSLLRSPAGVAVNQGEALMEVALLQQPLGDSFF